MFRSLIILAATIGLLFLADPVSATHDTDGDTWTDEYEAYLLTDPNDDCGGGGVNPTWPPDLIYSNFIDISDISQLTGKWGGTAGHGPGFDWPARFDLAPEPTGNGFVDISDIIRVSGLFGVGCTP